MVKRTGDFFLLWILIKVRPWLGFALSEYLECDDCLWMFGVKGASRDGYLKEYGDYLFIHYLRQRRLCPPSASSYLLGKGGYVFGSVGLSVCG